MIGFCLATVWYRSAVLCSAAMVWCLRYHLRIRFSNAVEKGRAMTRLTKSTRDRVVSFASLSSKLRRELDAGHEYRKPILYAPSVSANTFRLHQYYSMGVF
mmetsp:Transcript_22889/g.63552  ORF Transcript_22889/g.63552 Transcript_22889/m.63552 type:complete len:101 (+) Transcript_22889:726-1028(+)